MTDEQIQQLSDEEFQDWLCQIAAEQRETAPHMSREQCEIAIAFYVGLTLSLGAQHQIDFNRWKDLTQSKGVKDLGRMTMMVGSCEDVTWQEPTFRLEPGQSHTLQLCPREGVYILKGLAFSVASEITGKPSNAAAGLVMTEFRIGSVLHHAPALEDPAVPVEQLEALDFEGVAPGEIVQLTVRNDGNLDWTFGLEVRARVLRVEPEPEEEEAPTTLPAEGIFVHNGRILVNRLPFTVEQARVYVAALKAAIDSIESEAKG